MIRMRRLLRHARGVFAHLRELDAAASYALAPLLTRAGRPLSAEQSATLDDLELGT